MLNIEKLFDMQYLPNSYIPVPIEWLTLFFDMPYMLLISDIRQGIFYAALLSFWLVFTGEHLMESSGEKNTLRTYWKHLSAVAVGCVALFLFDLCERGAHVANPFYSLWATPVGTRLALGLIIAAGISASLYFIFLSWMVWRVFRNISAKRTALPAMSAVRRLHYQGMHDKTFWCRNKIPILNHYFPNVFCRHHLPFQILDVNDPGLRGNDRYRVHFGAGDRGQMEVGWGRGDWIHIRILHGRVWHVEYLCSGTSLLVRSITQEVATRKGCEKPFHASTIRHFYDFFVAICSSCLLWRIISSLIRNENKNSLVFYVSLDPYANTNSGTEEIEFTRLEPDTSEISALASFAKKVAAD